MKTRGSRHGRRRNIKKVPQKGAAVVIVEIKFKKPQEGAGRSRRRFESQ